MTRRTSRRHPDAVLLALGRQINDVRQRVDAAYAAAMDATRFAGATYADECQALTANGHDSLNAQLRELHRQLIALPAHTVAGLWVKLNCSQWCDAIEDPAMLPGVFGNPRDEPATSTALVQSLLRDVLAAAND